MRTVMNIQVLRGIAAMMVVVHHAIGQIPGIEKTFVGLFGHANVWASGVDIFFLISGFVIALTIAKPKLSVTDFITGRIARIVPLYWVFTLLLAAGALLVPSALKTTQITTPTLLKSLFFIPHTNLTFTDQIWPILVPGWSLNYEMFFYAVVAVGLVAYRECLLSYLTTIFVTLVAIGLVSRFKAPIAVTYVDPLMLLFLFGTVLAAAHQRGIFARHAWLTWCLLVGVLVLAGPQLSAKAGMETVQVFAGCTLIVTGALALEGQGRALTARLPLLLGDASYSIYLSHLFVLGAVRALWGKLHLPDTGPVAMTLYFAVALLACATAGIIIYRTLEQPLLTAARSLQRSGSKRTALNAR